jgi:CBS domain-containing protein
VLLLKPENCTGNSHGNVPIFGLESAPAGSSLSAQTKIHAMQNTDSVGALLRDKASAIHSITTTATVLNAIALMAERNIGALPVLQGGHLVGMLTERDYTRKVILMGRTSRDTLVGEIMTRDPKTVGPDDTVNDCMEIMTEHRVRHLPVIEDGKLLGILSIGDLVKWIMSAQTATIEHLTRYVWGEQVG